MVTVFTLHMMGAIPNAGPHIEFSIEPAPWLDGFLVEPLEAKDGMVQIPQGPGWGVEISSQWLAQAEHQISES
jgi:L-alanine-DL-glutamate epimerase-like enolase superfamily enzyme